MMYRILTALIVLFAVASCGSAENSGLDFTGSEVDPVPVSDSHGISVTSPSPGTALSAGVAELSDQLLVTVFAEKNLTTGSLLFELSYDAAELTPVVIQQSAGLTPDAGCLVLESTDSPGTVSAGYVRIDHSEWQISAGDPVAEILFATKPFTAGGRRLATSVPANANAVSPLVWDSTAEELKWYYVNPGDYDQNGEVGLSDLLPISLQFGATGPFDFTSAIDVVDGDRDGEISIRDITPIAVGLGSTVDGYRLYASDDVADIPVGFGDPSVINPTASFELGESLTTAAEGRLSFSYLPSPAQEDLLFWARPFMRTGSGPGIEGTRSNINGPANSYNPPVGTEFNFAPEAVLSLDLQGTHVPLTAVLDGSSSLDPDGTIAFYEWDFEGDGLVDAYGEENMIEYVYTHPGTYAPTLRVTDNNGAWDMFSSPSFSVDREQISNIAPFADLYATATSGELPLTVGLIASGSNDVDGYIAGFQWDFDGNGSTDLDSGLDPSVMHTYDIPGVHTCIVTVTDDGGATATAELDFEVIEIIVNTPPTAVVTVDPLFGDEGLTVTVDASGSSDAEGSIVQYEYDLDGDGLFDKYGSAPSVSQDFDFPDIHTVYVRVTDEDGAQDMTSAEVRVNQVFDLPTPWPAFGIDYRRTGRSLNTGPLATGLNWSFVTGGIVFSSPAMAADGTVIFGSHDGSVYAIDDIGDSIGGSWPFVTGGSVESSPAIAADGTIYIGSRDDSLYALNPDGTMLWSFPTLDDVISSPVIGPDGVIYVGSNDDHLYAINPDGSEKWSFTTSWNVRSSPAIGLDGTVYVGSDDNNLYAINPDGTLKWTFLTGIWINSTPAVDVDGTVYIGGGNENQIMAVNPDGTLKWEFSTGGWVYSSPAIGEDGTVYVGCFDENLYAINPDGSQKWAYDAGDGIRSSPAIGADGMIYFGSDGNRLIAIDSNGNLVWFYNTGGAFTSSPMIGADGLIYVGNTNTRLYCLGT